MPTKQRAIERREQRKSRERCHRPVTITQEPLPEKPTAPLVQREFNPCWPVDPRWPPRKAIPFDYGQYKGKGRYVHQLSSSYLQWLLRVLDQATPGEMARFPVEQWRQTHGLQEEIEFTLQELDELDISCLHGSNGKYRYV